MSQAYEMVFIIRPDYSEEQVRQVVDKYRNWLNERHASDLQIDVWGKRKLAYPIQNYQDGIYVQFNYNADGTQVAPLEREMRLGEDILRYLTLVLDESETADAVDTETSAPA